MNKFLMAGLAAAVAGTGTSVVEADVTECNPGGVYMGFVLGPSVHNTKVKIKEGDAAKYAEFFKKMKEIHVKANGLGEEGKTDKAAIEKKIADAKAVFATAVVRLLGFNDAALSIAANAAPAVADFSNAAAGAALAAFNAAVPSAGVEGVLFADVFGAVPAGANAAAATTLNTAAGRQKYQSTLKANAEKLFDSLLEHSDTTTGGDALYGTAYKEGKFSIAIPGAPGAAATIVTLDLTTVADIDKTPFYKKGTDNTVTGALAEAIDGDGRLADYELYEPKIKEIKDKYMKNFDTSFGKKVAAGNFDSEAAAAELVKSEASQYGPDKDGLISKTGYGFIGDIILGWDYRTGSPLYVGAEIFAGYDSYKSDVKPTSAITTDKDNSDSNYGIRVTRHGFVGMMPVVSIQTSGVRLFFGAGGVIGRYALDTTNAKYESAILREAKTLANAVNATTSANVVAADRVSKMGEDDQTVTTMINSAIENIKVDLPAEENAKFYSKGEAKWKPAGCATAGIEIPINPNVRARVGYSITFRRTVAEFSEDCKFEVKDTVHAVKAGILYTLGG
ncbi:MAG: hypothetical protein LBG13_03510 [Holosporales bacterium]|jgi:hypothetical protein|nr:hypothetical protein [Holosporales bacterium]